MPNRNSATVSLVASIALLMVLALCVPARAGDNPTSYSYARIVRLSYVQGDVQIVRADKSNKWEPAVMNMPVEQGFAIGTNDGRAEVEFEHGSMLWLAPNSVVQFTELALSSGGRITRITLSEGVATFEASLSAGDTFEVMTPTFTVMPGKSAEFRMGVRQKNAAVSVVNGKVSLGGTSENRQLAKGDMFVDEPGKKQAIALMRSPAPDEWDHWVNGRLTAEKNGQSTAALSANAPFSYGMADLADYGSWSNFPGFGYGWQPFGMAAGWAPFTDGQWMFYPTFGWTWISGEPWGWVPYHFGGWEYSPAFGWMWIPGNYGMWAAAPVQWYGFGNRVGWSPRGVGVVHPGSVATPVIISTKKLGKEGRNQVFSASEISARMQRLKMRSLAAAPEQNGRFLAPGAARISSARVVVPTAANLQGLRAGLAASTGAKINVNALHEAATTRTTINGSPTRGFTAVNGAVAAPRLPGRPPMRASFASPRMGGFGNSGNYGAAASTPSMGMQSPGRVAAPAAPATTAQPSGGSGRPR
ncbi:MAG TPA: FecR family protein [Candidatus Acidoferrales bacterium]|nr:FecR family protein [Candidatus Acidoferrales bacterium]